MERAPARAKFCGEPRLESRIGSPTQSLQAAARWLVPSVAGACAGAVAAGLVESIGGPHRRLATIGFVAMYAVPALVVIAALVRLLVRAWQPRAVIASLVEDDGSAPRLAGWVAVLWLATAGIAWAMFQGTWLLFSWTAFKVNSVQFLAPMLAVAAAFAILALSRPAARLLGWLARQADRVPRRLVKRSLMRPWQIAAGTALVTVLAAWLIWALVVGKRLAIDPVAIWAPLAGAIATVVAHAGRARWLGFARAGVIAAGVVAIVVAAIAPPKLVLAIWADAPLARRGIESRFVLEDIRTSLSPEEHALPPRTHARPDLVVVTFEGLRADRALERMPRLRALADRGTQFAWAFAASNLARRSIPSLLTGTSAGRVRGTFEDWTVRLDPRHVTIAERLRGGGYATALFACCDEWGAEARTGWTRGFDHVAVDPDGAALARAAAGWLARTPGPRFAWVHVNDVLHWQRGAEPRTEAERLALYDAALARADALLAALLAEHRGITIVAGTNGQGLGERGKPTYVADVYNAHVHVPLVIAGPDIKAQRITETVSLVDVVPTLLDLAGFSLPVRPLLDGRTLAPLAMGTRPSDPGGGTAYIAMIDERTGDPELAAIVRGTWKLIDTRQGFELYDLRSDAAERYNMFGPRPQIAGELKILIGARHRLAKQSPF